MISVHLVCDRDGGEDEEDEDAEEVVEEVKNFQDGNDD